MDSFQKISPCLYTTFDADLNLAYYPKNPKPHFIGSATRICITTRMRMYRALIIGVALIQASFSVNALTLMSINCDWFWDELPPHEGAIVSQFSEFPYSGKEVEIKAFAIAQLIAANEADLVAMIEIENEAVLKRVLKYLPAGWHSVFVEGRDTYTGQDVGLITRLQVMNHTKTNLPTAVGLYRDVRKQPSKILGVGVQVNGQRLYIIVTHLLSKRNGDAVKDKQRVAQANAIYRVVKEVIDDYDHVIVLGDINDTPGSITLKELRGINANQPLLEQPAHKDGPHRTVSMPGYDELIDHILVSDGLADRCGHLVSADMGPVSDHDAVVLRCDL